MAPLPLHPAALFLPQPRCCARSLVSGVDSSNRFPPALGWLCPFGMMLFCQFMGFVCVVYMPAPLPLCCEVPWGPPQLSIADPAWGQVHNGAGATESHQQKDRSEVMSAHTEKSEKFMPLLIVSTRCFCQIGCYSGFVSSKLLFCYKSDF